MKLTGTIEFDVNINTPHSTIRDIIREFVSSIEHVSNVEFAPTPTIFKNKISIEWTSDTITSDDIAVVTSVIESTDVKVINLDTDHLKVLKDRRDDITLRIEIEEEEDGNQEHLEELYAMFDEVNAEIEGLLL